MPLRDPLVCFLHEQIGGSPWRSAAVDAAGNEPDPVAPRRHRHRLVPRSLTHRKTLRLVHPRAFVNRIFGTDVHATRVLSLAHAGRDRARASCRSPTPAEIEHARLVARPRRRRRARRRCRWHPRDRPGVRCPSGERAEAVLPRVCAPGPAPARARARVICRSVQVPPSPAVELCRPRCETERRTRIGARRLRRVWPHP
jgi:hypothetical protein